MTIVPHFQNLTILCVFDVSRAFFRFKKNVSTVKKNTRLAIRCFVFSTFWKFEVQRQNWPFLTIFDHFALLFKFYEVAVFVSFQDLAI